MDIPLCLWCTPQEPSQHLTPLLATERLTHWHIMVYMWVKGTGSSLIQIMACCLFGTKPFPNRLQVYYPTSRKYDSFMIYLIFSATSVQKLRSMSRLKIVNTGRFSPRILIKSIENGYAWNRLRWLSGSKTVLNLGSEKVACENMPRYTFPRVVMYVCNTISHHSNRALNQLNPITKVMDISVLCLHPVRR